jgi:hypothetical protein
LQEEISTFVKKQAAQPFLKTLFIKDQTIAQIEGYHQRIGVAVQMFQESPLACGI